MSDYNQSNRLLTLRTAMGDDAFLVGDVVGSEGMSTLFSFEITAVASVTSIERADILGTSATLGIGYRNAGGERILRHVNGIVTSIAGGDFTRGGQRIFHIGLSPKLWLLDRTVNCAVYNDVPKVKDVIDRVLKRNGVVATFKLSNTYSDKEFRIQYNETDLAFVRRIAADEGIHFYFQHTADAHELVFSDSADYPDCALAQLEYRQGAASGSGAVTEIRDRHVLTDSGWKHTHYDFAVPSQFPSGELRGTVRNSAQGKVTEHYVFGEGQPLAAEQQKRSKDRTEEAEAAANVLEGRSTSPVLVPGHKFALAIGEGGASPRSYVVSAVEHRASDPTHLNQQGQQRPVYANGFTAVPSERIARPAPPARPSMQGTFVATVVGPSGEEIHTDKHGRVRVQFPWDQLGANDEKSSCFIRVSQAWAGKGWGSMFLPRVGMEVIVQFTGGDPDQPLITGVVYNGVNTPPFPLPADQTKSGLRTRSTKGGSAQTFNELSFEDKKGSELVFLRAQKDFERKVLNDDTLDVGHDQTRTVKNNRTTTISDGNDSLTVSTGNRSVEIAKGNHSLDVATGNLVVDVAKGNATTTLKLGNVMTKCNAGEITLEALKGITLKVGANTVKITPQGIEINGLTVTAKASVKAGVEGPIVSVKGSGLTEVSGGIVKIN